MATRQELQRILNDPNARKMLDILAKAEGVKHGYNTIFGNERFNDLSRHPNVLKSFTQTDGVKNGTTAAGRYQFLKRTWDGLSKQYGLNDFSPQNQDIGALALMAQKGALDNVLQGDFSGAVKKLGGTWASLPSSPYAQPRRSYSELGLSSGKQSQGLTAQQPVANRFLSQDQIAKVLPQLSKKAESPQRFLTADQITKVLPQLNQNSQEQPSRFLTQDQITKVLPQLQSPEIG